MSTAAFLDQDFGAESDDDATFNPAPGDESDNDPGEESDGTPPPDQDAKGRKLSGQGGNDLAAAQSIPAQEAASNDDETSNDASRGGRSQKKGKVRKATEAANGDGDDLAGDYEDGEEQTVNEGGDEKAEVDDDEQEADEDEDADEEEDDEAEEDEEDEEEDEDEDEEELKGHRRKRRRDRRVQGLFDVEAQVEDEEEEVDDEEDELREGDGFIADTHPDDLADLPPGGDADDRRHRELDRRREVEAGLDAERQAEELRKRYGRNRAAPTDSIVVPKRLLLPGVDDPSIWGVKCKPGKERDVVLGVMRRAGERAHGRSPLLITSAFERGGTMSGYVYVEARKQSDVLTALDGLSDVYPRTKMVLVPIKEMPDMLRTKKNKDIEPGAYVRVRRGKYQGDLAQVDSIEQTGLEVGLRLIPRLDYGLNEDVNAPTAATAATAGAPGAALAKRKRGGRVATTGKQAVRPPPRLFSEVEARKKHSRYVQPLGSAKNTWQYLNETYRNGFLVKDFKINLIQTESVNPTLEEVTRFTAENEDGTEMLDLNTLAASLKAGITGAAYVPGDVVEVFEGEQQGVCGRATSVQGDIVTLAVTDGALRGQSMDVPVKSLRKRFREGDHVKVVGGSRYRDEVGMVLSIKDDQVTILSDQAMQEITVFSKDLRKAVETGGVGSVGQYDLFDLVQLDPATVGVIFKMDRELLQVLDQNGSTRSILPSRISNKLEKRRHAVATDHHGSEIRVDDKVREVRGEGKQGKIMHIHRAFVFLHNREQHEDAGVFVARATNVATVAAKGGRVAATGGGGPDLTKMNPALQRIGALNGSMLPPAIPRAGGRDRLIGKTVVIRKGGHKGLLGIVKDTTDFEADVELHTRRGFVTTLKENLAIKDQHTGQTISYGDLAGGTRGRAMGRGSFHGAPPSRRPDDWQGSRTPMAANPEGFGGATPSMHASQRAPAWSSELGSRTPAWKQQGSGTPGFGADHGRTVNPYTDGSRTPYDRGNRTPAWNTTSHTDY